MGGWDPQKQKAYFKTWREQNHERHLEMQRSYRKRFPGRVALSDRAKKLRQNFGMTLEQYDELLDIQNGICAICGEKETRVRGKQKTVCQLAVDHDHDTGAVRGLLCQSCNAGLGQFRDNPEFLEKAASYLRIPWEQR